MINLESKDGSYSFFEVTSDGDAWHGLGKRVNRPLTAEEALEEARLDFRVVQSPAYFNDKEIPDKVVNYRQDNGEYLGTVGKRYSVIQNTDAFCFFDNLVEEGEAIYHTAGVLGKGEVVWILAKLPENIKAPDGNPIDKYVLLSNSHDGSKALSVAITPIRVVCQNTLNLALEKATHKISIRHSGDVKGKLREAHRVLGLTREYYEKFSKVIGKLHDVPINDEDVVSFTLKLFPDNEEAKNKTRTQNLRHDFLGALYNGKGQSIDNTLYWMLNGSIYYIDNFKKHSNSRVRLNNIVFQPTWKHKAFQEVSRMFTKKTGYALMD